MMNSFLNFKSFKKTIYIIFLVFTNSKSFAQITMEYNLSLFPDTKTYDGQVKLCNNSGKNLDGEYSFKVQWPAIETMNYGFNITPSGNNICDSLTLTTQSWDLIANNTCKTIDIGGLYNPPMFIPAKGIGLNGEEITLVHSSNSYIPGAENGGSITPKFYFDKDCFIASPKILKIGEATLLEWGIAVDMFFPENKKGWAIANAHAHSLFNNLVGKEIITPNHYNACALNESLCGCESDIIPDPSSTNPLKYAAHTVPDGCFQFTPTGWLQVNQFFPEFLDGLSHSKNVPGDYVRSCILRAYYDMSSLLYWEKVKCFKPLEMFEKSKDPYLAEELFGMAFYRGSDFAGLDKIFKTKRSNYVESENVVETLHQSGDVDNGSVIYGMRQRNNAKQLDNNTEASWATNSMYYNPSIFKWKGWYDDNIFWNDIVNYLDEIAPIYKSVNFNLIKNELQIVFNEISVEGKIPFTQLGPVIDKIVLLLPAFDGNQGMNKLYNSSMLSCNSSAISISSCSNLCPGEKGKITVNLMGVPPFDYSIEGPNGEIYSNSNVLGSPVILDVNDPGKYTVLSFSDANDSPFINCHHSSAVVKNKGNSDVDWDYSNISLDDNCSNGPLVLIGTGDSPWKITYERNNIEQETIYFSSSPFLIDQNPNPGIYKITKMDAGGCVSPNNSEITICNPTNTSNISESNLSIYPNPSLSHETIKIESNKEISFIEIYDSSGKKVFRENLNGVYIQNIKLSNNLKEGFYLVLIKFIDGNQATSKLLINQK
jgi:hypothetical protein